MKLFKSGLLYLLGGSAYVGLELIWRGRSHSSMFLAGGLCFLLVGHLSQVKPRLSFPLRAVTGAGIITMVELAAGLLVNRNYAVWDYRHMWGNFLGQICPAFTVLWVPVSALALVLYRWMDVSLDRVMDRPGQNPAGK